VILFQLETEAANLILSKVKNESTGLKKCLRHNIKVWCGTPVAFCEKEGLR